MKRKEALEIYLGFLMLCFHHVPIQLCWVKGKTHFLLACMEIDSRTQQFTKVPTLK